jgi:hypothetical protein
MPQSPGAPQIAADATSVIPHGACTTKPNDRQQGHGQMLNADHSGTDAN